MRIHETELMGSGRDGRWSKERERERKEGGGKERERITPPTYQVTQRTAANQQTRRQ